MALANIATLLAGRGRRVLVVDFDLEAPGLWRYFTGFRERLDRQHGLIDLLAAASAAPDSLDVDWRDYVTQVPVRTGGLSLITSGQLGESYSSKVLELDWKEFFQDARGGEFLERLRRQWREEYDFTLIDSRTGITDAGGICTIMLPDMIVPVFVSNYQSIEGAVEVITQAQAGRKSLAYDRPPAAILPILSRFESRAEYETAQEWLDILADRVKPFYDDWLPAGFSPRRALEKTKLPYVTFFSFGEKLPALIDSTSDPESLGYALNVVSLLIEQKLENAERILGSSTGTTIESSTSGTPLTDVAEPPAREGPIRLFLSFAEEDAEIATQIVGWLHEEGFEVFDWMNSRGGRFISRIEEELQNSDAFLALLSPGYLASPWCRSERELAIEVEQDRQEADAPRRPFLHVLQIQDVPSRDYGLLRTYDWWDLTDRPPRQAAIHVLADVLRSAAESRSPSPRLSDSHQVLSTFRDRRDELDLVLNGLTSEPGPHFWLVVAPPQLGKSWFLERIGGELERGIDRWTISLVDLRAESPELRHDASALLARIFGRPSTPSGSQGPVAIAQEISRSGRPRLCLLDSAELLEPPVAAALRVELGEIYKILQNNARKGVRLAVIVASRQTGQWLGIIPAPRLATLSLTEFGVEVVDQALRELAEGMGRTFSRAEMQANAALVHRVTGGMPVLLRRCLEWIEQEQWIAIDRLASQESLDELAGPYVQDTLFAQRSLLPEALEPADDARAALRQAFRRLSPHRLFTLSHLRFYADRDPGLRRHLANLDWSIEELWGAVSDASLLSRPLLGPWQEIEPAIRRLIFRYYYRDDTRRADAHSDALSFVREWMLAQSGTEQVVGLGEALWHEAIVLSVTHPAEMAERLSESARKLTLTLTGSAVYTTKELREYAARRMTADRELQEALSSVDGLFDRLTEIVAGPRS